MIRYVRYMVGPLTSYKWGYTPAKNKSLTGFINLLIGFVFTPFITAYGAHLVPQSLQKALPWTPASDGYHFSTQSKNPTPMESLHQKSVEIAWVWQKKNSKKTVFEFFCHFSSIFI